MFVYIVFYKHHYCKKSVLPFEKAASHVKPLNCKI